MKILSLEAERVKKLNLVNLKLNGDNLLVAGVPNQGKTTLIDLLWMAMDAKKVGKEVIQAGEKDGYTAVELGEPNEKYSVRVMRRFSEKGAASGRLQVSSGDGKSLPATFLADIVSNLSFDPLAFLRQKGLDQVRMLLSVSNISIEKLDDFDDKRDDLYERRADANREVKKWTAIVGEKPEKVERVDIKELSQKMADVKINNDKVKDIDGQLNGLKEHQDKILEDIEKCKNEILTLSKDFDVTSARMEKGQGVRAKYKIVDEKPLIEQLTNLQDINSKAEAWASWDRDSGFLKNATDEAGQVNIWMDNIEKEKTKMLAKAKWPVKGMDVKDGEVYYNNILLKNCGESQKLQISFAVAMSLNPTLKCCRLDGAESLGYQGRKNILEMANSHGYQVLMSRVSDDGPGSGELVIEEGDITK